MPWPPRLQQWRRQVEDAAASSGLPPELIAAVMDRESLGGEALTPPGPSGTGDFGLPLSFPPLGHGRGLMQIDDRAFPTFASHPELWQDAGANIQFGANLLNANSRAVGGDIPSAVAAYNCGLRRVLQHKGAPVAQLDALTTGGNYVSDVLSRMNALLEDG